MHLIEVDNVRDIDVFNVDEIDSFISRKELHMADLVIFYDEIEFIMVKNRYHDNIFYYFPLNALPNFLQPHFERTRNMKMDFIKYGKIVYPKK